MKLTTKDWLDVPVTALLAANTAPLFGVLFLGWDAFYIVVLYWAENVVIGYMYSVIPPQVRLAVLALFASHGVSFVQNYLLKGEYAAAKPNELMGSPYGRVVVMHIAILTGGFLTMAAGSPAPLLLVLVALKTALDINLHNREHKKAAAKAQS